MSTSTRFPHHNHLEKETSIQMILNAVVPNVFISSISFCIKMHKASLLSNVTETCSCKRPCPDPQIDCYILKKSVIMNLFSIENVYLFQDLTVGVVK